MSYFNITILGCGSATPSTRHNPSAQAVRYRNKLMLVDCAEGTQLQMRRYGLSFAKVSDIFISHLHGDHFLGLPGLLSTMSLHNVEGTVTVHTFAEGADILKRLMNVFYHRVPCVGYLFREKPKRPHIDGEAVKFHGVPHYLMNAIKDGADFVREDGSLIPNSWLVKGTDASCSYAYCSDTAFDTRVADAVRGCDVLFHEATYGDDSAHKAAPRGHSTARDAGRIATLAGAGRLVIGHFSKTILNESRLVAEASEEFHGPVTAANEGLQIDII